MLHCAGIINISSGTYIKHIWHYKYVHDYKYITLAGRCDLNEYLSTNFTIPIPKPSMITPAFAVFVSALVQQDA